MTRNTNSLVFIEDGKSTFSVLVSRDSELEVNGLRRQLGEGTRQI